MCEFEKNHRHFRATREPIAQVAAKKKQRLQTSLGGRLVVISHFNGGTPSLNQNDCTELDGMITMLNALERQYLCSALV